MVFSKVLKDFINGSLKDGEMGFCFGISKFSPDWMEICFTRDLGEAKEATEMFRAKELLH